ncbi:uncharacterized protein LOC129741272 [Uranotaenia lowii]|uniref:uncharacterized protein LOC129741272 n=1 Tax=Uranotaenia lowii TaxID=190385 RepID=UPI00247982C5|nr:uncharacterized protein LOC129741272 [Uranotaenia lowii]
MSAAERKLRGLKNRKRSITTSFAGIVNFVNEFQQERDAVEVPVRLENFVELWKEFNAVQQELEIMEDSGDDKTLQEYLKERTDFERNYYRIKGTLLLYAKPSPELHDTTRRSAEPSHQMNIKLPDVKIPIFNGNFDNWLNFHDLFVSLIHSSTSLSTIQKIYYLRSSLAGEALKIIQTIPISNDQYQVAWNMLVDHFQNPRRLKRTYVQSLFEFPCLKRESPAELHTLIEGFEANVKILKQLGEATEHWDALLIHLLSVRLDPITRRDWEEYAENENIDQFPKLVEFLQRRVNVLQTVSTKPSTSQQPSFPAKKPAFPRVSNYGSVQNSGFQRNCFACSGQHNIYQCASFNNMSVDERENVVRRNQLCRNCLRRGHLAKTCSSESSCRNCNSRHHTKLCSPQRFENKPAQNIRSNKPSPPIPKPDNQASDSSVAHSGVTSCSSHGSTSRKVLLATAVILMVDDTGNEYPVRALLDSGSECCFIAERVSQRMKVQRNRVDVPIAGIGQSSTCVRSKLRSTFKSRISSFKATVDLFVLPKVTVDLPTISIDASAWEIPTGIQLADPAFYESAKIDVVLGADVFFDLFNVPGRISMGDSMPHLVNSVFGWIISGKVPERKVNAPLICNVATTADLHRDMERFWLLETDDSPAYSPDEILCEKLFVESVSRSSSGRYMVRLTMKQDVLKNLCDNRRTDLHRFRLLEGRLKRSPQLAIQYREFMDDYINLGHMKQIDDSSIDHQPSFFLPHHPVVREQSSTTKLRVVFDASCKSSSGISLNDAMLVGPTIQDDLRSIILRSRIHPILIVADVAKMFRQIESIQTTHPFREFSGGQIPNKKFKSSN